MDEEPKTPGPKGSRVHGTADFYAAAVYGSILSTGVVAAFREEHESAGSTALSLLATVAVLWLAHVWSSILGERIHLGRGFDRRQIVAIARAEWPLVEAGFLPTLVLAIGWAGLFSDRIALDLALAVCVVDLFGWGFVVGRRAYDEWWPAWVSSAANGALGLLLVGLEQAIGH